LAGAFFFLIAFTPNWYIVVHNLSRLEGGRAVNAAALPDRHGMPCSAVANPRIEDQRL
jgi:hypothetical protein